MSGHSKWSTIKRKKGAKDAKRGIIFTQLSKDITLAAKESGANLEMNAPLRLAVKKAKQANMPNDNIERAINKGIGNLPGVIYEDFIYEGYGPYGVAILMEVMTDNKNRTVPDIRHIMSKNGGNLGESGCVSWMFKKKGTITIDMSNHNEDDLLEKIFDIGVEDFEIIDSFLEISTTPDAFAEVSSKLESSGYDLDGEVGLVPDTYTSLNNEDSAKVISLIESLEELDDVQKVYSNFTIDKE